MNKVAKIVFEDGTEKNVESGIFCVIGERVEKGFENDSVIQEVSGMELVHIVVNILEDTFEENSLFALRKIEDILVKKEIARNEIEINKEESEELLKIAERLAKLFCEGVKNGQDSSSK